jgi:hypothetical protein
LPTAASWQRFATSWLIPAAVIAVLFSPIVLTDRPFWVDSSNHLWLLDERRRLGGGWSSYFVSSDRTGLFFPVFLFYGGAPHSLFGAFAALTGSTLFADAMSWLLPFVLAFGGLTWLSRQAGLFGWRSHIAGLLFVTSPYFLTNVYGRGAWTEALATSALPMVAASGVRLLRSWHWFPMLAFAGSTAIVCSTHNITLVWGGMFLAVMAIVAACAFRPRLRQFRMRRAAGVVALAAVSAGTTAAFLLPNAAYMGRTVATRQAAAFYPITGPWFQNVFVPRFVPFTGAPPYSTTPDFYLQLPMFLVVWLIMFRIAARARPEPMSTPLRRCFGALSAVGGVLVVLLAWPAIWVHLPKVLRYVQFADRLNTYVVLVLVALTIVCLRDLADRAFTDRRVWMGSLTAIAAVSVVAGVVQVWVSSSALAHRSDALARPDGVAPISWYDAGLYNDASAPIVDVTRDRFVMFDPAAERRGSFEQTVDLPPGFEPIGTNIATGSYLIDVKGVEVLGRTAGNHADWCYLCNRPTMVVRRLPGQPSGPVEVRIEARAEKPVTAGRWLSIGSLAVLGVWLGASAAFSPRRRRSVAFRASADTATSHE